MRVLLIEDDNSLAQTLQDELSEYFVVERTATGGEGENRVYASEFDCIILDYVLPDMTGLEFCQRIRAEKIQTPILMLTGESKIQKKVEALNAGADDYLTKPFVFEELLARIRALLRRSPKSLSSNVILVGDLEVDLNTKIVKREGKNIELRRKEFYLLEYLARNVGQVITRDMILDHVWKTADEPITNTIDVHIKYLRDRIDKAYKKKLIKTVHGLGYKIEA
jgi:DNA-binding response OmpR family regulator